MQAVLTGYPPFMNLCHVLLPFLEYISHCHISNSVGKFKTYRNHSYSCSLKKSQHFLGSSVDDLSTNLEAAEYMGKEELNWHGKAERLGDYVMANFATYKRPSSLISNTKKDHLQSQNNNIQFNICSLVTSAN